MALREDFMRALGETQIIRQRQSSLLTLSETELAYVLLSESAMNVGDTVVRKGVVKVDKPQLLLLNNPTEFEGFEYEDNSEENGAFMALARMASFPPGKYSNIANQMEVYSGSLEKAIDHYERELDRSGDHHTGLCAGPVDIWALSLFVYVGKMVAKSASSDLDDMINRENFSPWN
ncbi:MAG: hypothetical protein QF437_02440 [Planctomycetota bacterium]|nr:hypothetical protein [Planctomycetota bacterium]MDP7129313.1 hypothetical protein [Planctomycetota bacterium]MDP7250231.1 hypothetical protein [Planctomycetota bacterium]